MGSLAANRYAKSLMGLAIEKNTLENVYADMVVIANTVESNKDFGLLLKSPVVKTDKKQDILKAIFGSSISEMTTLFLELISSRKREGIIGNIATSFIDQYKRFNKIVVAEVTSAVSLDEGQKQKILGLLKSNEASHVEVIEKINPDIIGGFIVRVDDQQIDASVAREFSDLRQKFSENPYIPEY